MLWFMFDMQMGTQKKGKKPWGRGNPRLGFRKEKNGGNGKQGCKKWELKNRKMKIILSCSSHFQFWVLSLKWPVFGSFQIFMGKDRPFWPKIKLSFIWNPHLSDIRINVPLLQNASSPILLWLNPSLDRSPPLGLGKFPNG